MNTDKENTVSQKPSSPDELNRLLKITHPYHWLTISALGGLALFAIVWSIFGSIPQRIQGIGEITTMQGLHGVSVRYQGELQKIFCNLGDTIKEGQMVAKVSQPELEQQLIQLYNQKDILQNNITFLRSNNSIDSKIKSQSVQVQQQRLQKEIAEYDKKIAFLQRREKEQEKLYADGLITYAQCFNTKDELFQAQTGRNRSNEELISLDLGQHEWSFANKMKEEDVSNQLLAINKKVKELQEEYDLQTNVRASATGIVTNVNVNSGDYVRAGESLFTVEEIGNEAFRKLDLFIPFNSNAQVLSGMQVQIEPFTVDHNLYGWMLGKVIAVNQYVSSQASLNTQLDDPELVSLIVRSGPVYRVEVELLKDSTTVSGYAFSNRKGPPFKLQTGTLCNAYVEVKQKSPIDYLIPIFKGYFE